MLSLPPGEFREHQSTPQCCSSFQQLLLESTNLSIPHAGMKELLEVIPAGAEGQMQRQEGTVWALGWAQGMMQLLSAAFRPFSFTHKIHKMSRQGQIPTAFSLYFLPLIKIPSTGCSAGQNPQKIQAEKPESCKIQLSALHSPENSLTSKGKRVLGQIPAPHLQIWEHKMG